MSTHRLRRTETAQRLATPVSIPTSGSNTTLPRPYGSHTVSTLHTYPDARAARRRQPPPSTVPVPVPVDDDDGSPGSTSVFAVTSLLPHVLHKCRCVCVCVT